MTAVPELAGRSRFRATNVIAAAAIILLIDAQAAFSQTLGQGADNDISLWRVAAALVLCTLLAAGGALVLRARSAPGLLPLIALGRPRRMQLVESLRLGQNANLSIVACDGRELLILVSQDGSRVLDEAPLPRKAVAGTATERA